MKGTEKQVKWAENLKAKAIKATENALAMLDTMEAPADKKAAAIAEQNRRIEVINRMAYAGDVIDAFKGLDYARDSKDAIRLMNAAFRGFETLWRLD